jgi:hypothetical protein
MIHALSPNPPSPQATARLRFASVVDFPHPRGFRLFSGRSGVFPSIGGGFEHQKLKSSAWARLGSLKTAWARLARGCREMIIARKWGYGDAGDPKRRLAKQTFQFTIPVEPRGTWRAGQVYDLGTARTECDALPRKLSARRRFHAGTKGPAGRGC